MFGTWPFVPFFNQNKIVLGVPLLMLWVYIVVFTTTFLMWLSSKMGVYTAVYFSITARFYE